MCLATLLGEHIFHGYTGPGVIDRVDPVPPEVSLEDAYTPIKGKCMWWREALDEEERWDTRIKPEDMTVRCFCFIEGRAWAHKRCEVPADCPESRRCRYYIRHG